MGLEGLYQRGLGCAWRRLEAPMGRAFAGGDGACSVVVATATTRGLPRTQEAYAFREEPVTSPLFSLNPVPYPQDHVSGDRRGASSGRVSRSRMSALSWLSSWKRDRLAILGHADCGIHSRLML